MATFTLHCLVGVVDGDTVFVGEETIGRKEAEQEAARVLQTRPTGRRAAAPVLLPRGDTLHVAPGAEQGDPLGPLYFAFALAVSSAASGRA